MYPGGSRPQADGGLAPLPGPVPRLPRRQGAAG